MKTEVSDAKSNKIEQKINLEDLDLEKFVGRTTKELLSAIEEKPISHSYFDFKPGLLAGVLFKFENGLYLRVEVDKFYFLTQFDASRNWDLIQFKKESITRVSLEK